MVALVLFGVFIICFVLTVPIGISLGVASISAIWYSDIINITYFAQKLTTAADSFPLMAVPFFILAGNLMGSGGVSRRLLDLATICFGRMSGGLALVTIAACMFFGAISGSAAATVAAIGTLMVPDMINKGYDKSFSSALIAASGGLGAIIPPSLSMVIYCVATEQSISELFLAGVIPGILLGLGFMVYSYFYAKKKGYSGAAHHYTLREKLDIVWEAKWAIVVPVIILGGIYGGIFTPTEAAAVAVAYGWFIGTFIYKELTFRDLPKYLLQAAVITATLLVIIGTSAGFGSILTLARIPNQIANLILSLSDNTVIILLMINALLLFVGTFMETLAAIIILAPMLLPLIHQLGIDPIHFGLIMCVNLAIGYITPPLGANLFVACGVTGTPFSKICRSVIPFTISMILTLGLLTYVPQLTMFLPKYFMRGMALSQALAF